MKHTGDFGVSVGKSLSAWKRGDDSRTTKSGGFVLQ